MKSAIFAAIFLMMATSAFAGRITPWGDPDVFYPNSGRIQYIDLYMTLDTKLPLGHVMRISLPFSTQVTITSTTVYAAGATTRGAWAAASSSASATTTGALKTSQSTAPFSNYFTFGTDLAAATPYVIRLRISPSPTDVGFLGYIQVETMSPALSVTTSGSDQAISYDLNNAFAPLHIFAAPGSITSFTMASDSNSLVGGQTSVRQISFVPTQNFFYWPLIQLSWDNTNFAISNLVSIDTGVNATVATPLTASTAAAAGAGNFYTTNTTSSLLIYHNAQLFTNQTVKYNISTANPSGTATATINFNIMIMHRYNFNLTDVSSNVSFSVPATSTPTPTPAVTINSYNILLSWGVDPAVSTLNANLAKVFSIYATPAANQVYQALRWVFGVSAALSSQTYTVTVSVCNAAANCDVLENSIVSNMTGASCYYSWGTQRSIVCTTTAIAATGNSIGARVWYMGATSGSTGMLTTATAATFPSSFSDSTAGTITITVPSNSSFSPITATLSSTYNKITYNYLPLVNINGNGPLAAIPASGNLPDGTTAYTTLWGTGTTNLAGSAAPFGLYALPTTTAANFPAYGGIYGTANSGVKYNVALFTQGIMTGTGSARGTFDGGAVVIPASNIAGLDLFLNPNLYAQATPSSTASLISSCWAGSAATKPADGTVGYYSGSTDSASLPSAHCFSNSISTANQAYTRLRWLATTVIGAPAPMGTPDIETVAHASTPKYMSFFWESAISMISSYTGASLKADNNVGDFYGVFYTYGWTGSPTLPIKSGGTNPTDAGELPLAGITGATTSTITVGTPFMWSQMILGPYGGGYTTNTNTAYYKHKQVFLSGYFGTTAAGAADTTNHNSNTHLSMIRIRGYFNTSSGDNGLYPTAGRIAVFIGYANGAAVLNPLAGANVTNIAGTSGYNAATVTGAPLVSGGAIRCWNAGVVGNCLHERYGRVLPVATPYSLGTGTFGVIGALDLYQIISSDATFTSNFSIAILVKPSTTAPTAANYFVRFGFYNSANGNYMLQSWDQGFDVAATVDGTTGVVSNLNAAFPAFAATQYPAANISCNVPYGANANTVAIRLNPAATDLDNNLTASVTLNVNQGASTGIAAVTASLRQGYVSFCAPWNFKSSSSFSATSSTFESAALGDKCVGFDYLGAETVAVTWYCVVCPIAAGAIPIKDTAASPVAITLNNFFDGPAVNIYQSVATNIAGDNGAYKEWSYCTNTIATNGTLWQPQVMTATAASSSFNIQGQKVSIPFVAPSTLALADSITLNGKFISNSTADAAFPYMTLDAAAVCRLAPTATLNDISTYGTCTAGNASAGVMNISAITIPAAQASITSWTLLLWGVNGNTATANSPTTTYFTIQTNKGGQIVDQSSQTNTSYVTWTLSNLTNASFGTANVAYQRPFVGARGWFKFDVVFATRTWFFTDKVVLNLDAVISSTVNNNSGVVKCRITDTSDVLLQTFQSCTLAGTASPATLTIMAMPPTSAARTVYQYDFSAGTGIRVYLDNMVTLASQTNKTIWGNIYFQGATTLNAVGAGATAVLTKNTTGTDVTSSALTTTAFPANGANITKWWNNANDFQDLTFSLSTSSVFNSSCRITIVFPSYYNPGLTTRSTTPYCTIGGTYTQCVVGSVTSAGVATLSQGLRSLVVYGFSGSVAAGSNIVLRVNGISAPSASYTAETFWIQINGDNTESAASIIYGGAVSDASYTAPTTAVMPLNVNWFTVSSTAPRTFSTFTWTFGLNLTGGAVNTTQAIQAVFPESWSPAWGEFTPTCTVYDFANNSVVYASSQSTFGNLLQLNVSTQIPSGNVVTLACQNVRSPNGDTTYSSQDVTIRVVDANGGAVYQRSAPGVHNVNFKHAFAKTSSQTYTSWSQTSSASSPLALTAGTYGLTLTLTVPSRSSRSFTVTPSNSQFAFLSSAAPFWLVYGATTNSTQLGCAGSVPVGLYVLTFTVSDNSSTYIAPSAVWIGVNSNAVTITPSSTTATAFYSSSSLSTTAPVYFDLTNYPPYSDITITPVAPTGNTNFTVSPASIRLTAASPKNYFVFTSTSAATVVGSAAYTFTLSGTNAASYTLSSSVTVSLTTDPGTGSVNTPALTVAADSSDQSLPTTKILTFTLTQVSQATIYWVVTLQGQSITDAAAIQTNAAALTQYNANSANQAQYFTTYQVASPKSPSTVSVSNLFPNTGYTVSAVAVSNTNKSSTVASFTFVTGATTATIQRWLFNYTTYPNQAQRQSLLCLITQTLAVPAINVRNVNGEICGNTTAFYSTSNSTGDLGIYFYPLQANTDTTMTATALQTALNGTNVLAGLNATLSAGTTGLGWQNVYVDLPIIRNAAPVLTLPSTIPSGQLTSSSIYFNVIASNDTGYLFVAVASNTTATPTAVALKQAAANISSISGVSSIQVFYFYPGANLTYNFTGLNAATSYNVFIVASNNDPSFLQNFTSVTAITVTTPSTGSTTAGQMGVIFSVMAVFVSVISLMFF